MSGARYDYIRVPTAYNNVGFVANDLVDYNDHDGALQRSLSGYSDDTASLGSPTYAVSPSLDTFNYNFDSSQYSTHQVPASRPDTTTSSGPYTSNWTESTSLRSRNTYTSQPVVTSSVNVQPSSVMSNPSPEYVCLYDGCRQKAFRRSADLGRHIKHVHLKPPDVFFCDYNRCPRSEKALSGSDSTATSQPFETVTSPTSTSSSGTGSAGVGAFGRKDHCRAHYRDYHREDLCRRNGKEAAGWFDDRNISGSWWRCTKCLRRVSYSRCGWECRDCGQMLEPERINARKRKMGSSSKSLSSASGPSSSSSRGY